ncbi:hypothetical protein HZC08_01525, partial [Candidatus Micrarchaeota archaeon]|nr:hypothetical protein [Candidatus Micrarchaeota archaeon]
MLLHGTRIERSSAIESTARFKSVSPVSEGIFSTAFHRIKSFTIRVVTATFLFASVVSPYSCSNVSAAPPTSSKKVEIKDSDAQSNVTAYEKGVLCGPNFGQFKGSVKEESMDYLKQLMKERDDKESQFWKSNEKSKIPVTLSELNDPVKKIVEIVAGEMGSQAIEKGIEKLVEKNLLSIGAAAAFKKALLGLTALDLCAADSEFSWGAYYKSLCYKDTDEF